jgi:hypothetical protein
MQHRSVPHHHAARRSMTRTVCLLPTPPTLQRANQPVRPHTGRWKCLPRTRRTNLAWSPWKGVYSQSTTLEDTLRRTESPRKANPDAHEKWQGKPYIRSAAQHFFLFSDLMQKHTRSLFVQPQRLTLLKTAWSIHSATPFTTSLAT